MNKVTRRVVLLCRVEMLYLLCEGATSAEEPYFPGSIVMDHRLGCIRMNQRASSAFAKHMTRKRFKAKPLPDGLADKAGNLLCLKKS